MNNRQSDSFVGLPPEDESCLVIIGGSGLVGRILIKKTKDIAKVHATYNTTIINLEGAKFYQLDVRDANRVNELMKEIQPDTVINATGERNTRYCEKNPDEAYKVNVEGAKNIVNACKTINAKMVFISSDLVFDGTKGKYSEEDEVNPLNVYGKQKVMAEKIINDNLDNWLIARASSIYGWDPGRANFVSWVIEELKNGREIQIVYDQYITPIYVGSLAYILIQLLENNKTGVYHVGEGECLNKYEFVKKIAEVFGFDENLVKAISSDKLNQNIKTPKDNCLDLTKIRGELDFSEYSLIKGLQALKKEALNSTKGCS